MKKFIIEIDKNDCVGDSAGKHNFNLLSLDSNICNLSSTFYNIPFNYKKLFSEYESYIPVLTTAYTEYNTGSMFRYDLCYTATQIMSSFWNKHEFTVSLNTNMSFDYDDSIIGIISNNTSIEIEDRRTQFLNLETKCKDYLNLNFNASNFLPRTTAHIVACYFSNIQYKDETASPNMSASVSFKPDLNSVDFNTIPYVNSGGNLTKSVDFEITKPSVHINGFYMFSYSNLGSGKTWALMRVLPDNTLTDLNLKINYQTKTLS